MAGEEVGVGVGVGEEGEEVAKVRTGGEEAGVGEGEGEEEGGRGT